MANITRTSIPCPGCGAGLIALTQAEAVIGGCAQCAGIWLNHPASRQLMDASLSEEAREFVRAVSSRAAGPDGHPYRSAAPTGSRGCPVCRRDLAKMKLRAPALEIDVCSEHGAYLDRGELGTIWVEASVRAAELDMAAEEMTQQVAAHRSEEIGRALDTIGFVARVLR